MAKDKMTQAERTAAAANAKDNKRKSKKKATSGPQVQTAPEPQRHASLPVRITIGAACFLLFIMFLLVAMKQDGYILTAIGDLFKGLFGKVAFLVAIPGMLYLSGIQLFSGNQPTLLRSCCTLGFVFLCGCIAHLCAPAVPLDMSWETLTSLYTGGIVGSAGGVICGLVTELLRLAFDQIFSFVLLILGAVLTLMAACGITIPSLVRAIQDRPRLDDGAYERPQRQEPAAVVVNHIANKRIAHVEKKRRLEADRAAQMEEENRRLALEEAQMEQTRPKRAKEILRQITPDFDSVESEPDVPRVIPIEPEPPVRVVPEAAEVQAQVAVEPDQGAAGEGFAPVFVPEVVDNKKVTAKDAAISAQEIADEIAKADTEERPLYCFPPIDLLRRPRAAAADGTAEMRENTRRLNESLASFHIEAHISNVTRGPSVTRYEVELEKGVRLSKLTSAAEDIALSLGASGVRIAPVPGKISVVGIEVPNAAVTAVPLREVIDSQEFIRAESKSSFAVGKDIGGNCIVGNIAKLPHMLIAGTTGSGKSVCMNSIIISLLYKASPDDVKLIMVDPKMVELGIYNGIPHLLIPVVTDPKKAAGSLQWAVTEMMRRYRSMSDAGVRDLESYNSLIDEGMLEGEHLPEVVVIIDELADLMLVAAKEVEESICRIAQMGRASGIHLIIATQRPSADVITGTMKANIPSRIAFAVASAMESRIILDNPGAEKLVGKGDMLYAPTGCGKPQRVQGCFVSDAEVEAVTTYIKEKFTTTYDQTVMDEIEKKAKQTGNKSVSTASEPEPSDDELAHDELLPAAVDVILETKQASVSMLQRRLKLGYARAARIVDEMAELGIVGPYAGSKPRQILITPEQWAQMQSGQKGITEPVPNDFPDDAPAEE